MNEERSDPPLYSRPMVGIADFCSATGWDLETVDRVVAAGRLEVLVDDGDHVVGLFDDALPTRAELEATGHSVNPAYDPATLRSHPDPDPGSWPDDGSVGDTWSMTWGDDV